MVVVPVRLRSLVALGREHRGVPVLRQLSAVLAEERHEDQPEHVEGRHHRAERETDQREVRPAVADVEQVGPGGLQDRVLRVVAREERDPRDRHRADQRRREGDRHLLPEPAHHAHVLHVVAAVDDRTGRQEQARLEERVRDHVEHARLDPTETDGRDHEAELRDRGVGQDGLQVVDHQSDGRREQRGDRADDGDDRQDLGRHQRVEAPEQEHAGRDHGRGVDHRAHGRRARHRVRQPDVQRELGRLADRTAEGEQARRRHPGRVVAAVRLHHVLRHLPHVGEAQRVEAALEHRGARGLVHARVDGLELAVEDQDADQQADVADARRHEGLLRGPGRPLVEERLAGIVAEVTDEQVAHQAHDLPEDEQEEHVVRQHQRQHREREQRDVREEDRVALVPVHVPLAEQVHAERDDADHGQHPRAERVVEDPGDDVVVRRDLATGAGVEPAELEPELARVVQEVLAVRAEHLRGHVHGDAHDGEHAGGQDLVAGRQLLPQRDLEEVAEQRNQRHREEQLEVRFGQAGAGQGREETEHAIRAGGPPRWA